MSKDNKRKGFVRRSMSAVGRIIPPPAEAVNFEGIRAGGRLLAQLVHVVRSSRHEGDKLRLEADAVIDLGKIAAISGRSPDQMVIHLLRRREETRRAAVLAFWAAWALLAVWVFEAIFLSWNGSRLLSAFEFLPLCLGLFRDRSPLCLDQLAVADRPARVVR